jgi:hypothetical protein
LGKLIGVAAERALNAVSKAALPEFVAGGMEKNRRPVAQEFAILRLNEGASAERDDAGAWQGLGEQIAKGVGFGEAKAGFSAVAKDLRDGLLLARLDSCVQVDEVPTEAACQFRADGALAGSHESYEKDSARLHGRINVA